MGVGGDFYKQELLCGQKCVFLRLPEIEDNTGSKQLNQFCYCNHCIALLTFRAHLVC